MKTPFPFNATSLLGPIGRPLRVYSEDMMLSRRTVLFAAIARTVRAQGTVPLTISNRVSGLRLERHGDPQRPSVAVFLPDAKDPSAVIELPEHAWSKQKAVDDQAWFYKMYSSEPSLQGQVEWSKLDDGLAFSMKMPSGFSLNSTAILEPDGVSITHEVSNGAGKPMAAVEAVTCVKLYRPFTDVFLDRTYVHHREGLELIASETPDRTSRNAEEWLPCRYIASVGRNAPRGTYRVEHLDGVTRYFKSRPADAAFLATESTPPGWTAATFARDCASIFTNPARTCHHADPMARDVAGGRATLKLKVCFIRGSAQDAWSRAVGKV